MTPTTITRILTAHGITYEQRANRILAHDVFTAPATIDLSQLGTVIEAVPVPDDPARILVTTLADVTDWTRADLFSWLGY